MTARRRIRALAIVALVLFAGAAAAVFNGTIPFPAWQRALNQYAGHEPSASPSAAHNKNVQQGTQHTSPAASRDSKKFAATDATAPPKTPDAQSEKSQDLATSPQAKPPFGFDIARIDPNGVSVFAGHATPNAKVVVEADGVEIGTAQAGPDGDWTLVTENKLPSADPKLSLTLRPAASAANSDAAEPAQTAAANPSQDQLPPKQPLPASKSVPSVSTIQAGFMRKLEDLVIAARASVGGAQPKQVITAAATGTAIPPSFYGVNPALTPRREPPGPNPSTATSYGPSIPVLIPVTFVFREPTLTPDGEKAAGLLLEYVKLKRFKALTLTGHADERGSDQLNYDLSRDRLNTIAGFLRKGGYAGELNLIPKGKSEPFTGVDRAQFDQEDLYQLDRRVELRPNS